MKCNIYTEFYGLQSMFIPIILFDIDLCEIGKGKGYCAYLMDQEVVAVEAFRDLLDVAS